jgi:hypothetical protein
LRRSLPLVRKGTRSGFGPSAAAVADETSTAHASDVTRRALRRREVRPVEPVVVRCHARFADQQAVGPGGDRHVAAAGESLLGRPSTT